MYKCNNCNKEFEFESEYNRHKNKKIPCNEIKKEYKCEKSKQPAPIQYKFEKTPDFFK